MFDIKKALTANGGLSSEKIKRLDKSDVIAIENETSFLPEGVSTSIRLKYLLKGITQPRLCKYCNQPMIEKTVDWHYYEYCSRECSKQDIHTILEKSRATCKERHGVENFFKDPKFQANIKQHWIDKCGVASPFGIEEIREKRKLTFIKNYGVDNPMKNPEFAKQVTAKFMLVADKAHEKARQTMFDRYGVYTPMESQEFKQNFIDSRKSNYYENRSICFDKDEIKRLYDIYECSLYRILNVSPSHMYTILKSHGIETSGRSFLEKFISNLLESNGIDHLRNKKINKDPYIFDIVIPSKMIVIETNGAYWHKDYDDKYHLSKMTSANTSGYTCIYLQEHQIMSRPDACENLILSKLGLNNKIHGRKTKVTVINPSTARDFCESHHIQGYRNSSINIGLYNGEDLVQVACFAKPLFDKTTSFELTRMCSKSKTTVVGGASKLIKYFIKEYKPDNLISYAQKDYSCGGVYEAIGFTKVKDTPPSYFYSNGVQMYSRYQCQKHMISKSFKHFSPELTEVQNMEKNNYFRVFDCGTSKYMISCNLEESANDKKHKV